MNIDETIKQLIEKHKAIIAINPEIHEIVWHINDVPYKVFDRWRTDYNTTNVISNKDEHKYLSQNNIGNKLYLMLHSWVLKVEKMRVDIQTVPVKFEHTYSAIEEVAE